MSAQPDSRQQRILQFVAGRGDRGASLHDIVDACHQPEPREAPLGAVDQAAERLHTVRLFSAQLHQLAGNGKLARAGRPMAYRYFPTPKTLVDGRRTPASTTAAKPPSAARKPAPKAKPAAPAAPPARRAPVTAAQKFVMVPAADFGSKRLRGTDSDRIAADVAAFMRRGGVIEKLAMGASSQSLRVTADDHNPASPRQRLQKQANAARDDADAA